MNGKNGLNRIKGLNGVDGVDSVYGLCGMCKNQCPIEITLERGKVSWIFGNPHAGANKAVCPCGVAGISLLNDTERLREPLIRNGERGSGKWRKTSWDEACEYVAEKLKKIIQDFGPQSCLFGDGDITNGHISNTFMQAIGSCNYFTTSQLYRASINTAAKSILGYSYDDLGIDYTNTKHIVFYGRNFFETINVKDVNDLFSAVDKGATITCIDPRVSITATKSHQYLSIKPGTDLALNNALINLILKEELYDRQFVDDWVVGLDELKASVAKCTVEWAAKETGIDASEIRKLAVDISNKKPSVVFHYGNRGAGYQNEAYLRRSIFILNCLMGAIEVKGGIYLNKEPLVAGSKNLRRLDEQNFPPLKEQRRFCGCSSKSVTELKPYLLPDAILNEKPYPIKALLVKKFNPLLSIPNYNHVLKALQKLELLVAIDINMSETAIYADVILPESTYLERMSSVKQQNDLVPKFLLSRAAVAPLHNTLSGAMIIKKLAEKMGVEKYFPYRNEEELNEYMLDPTGFSLDSFNQTGMVDLTERGIWWERSELKFPTASGKIEFKSSYLEKLDHPSFIEYQSIEDPPSKSYRLLLGGCPVHNNSSTQNNVVLNEIMSENILWIHPEDAADNDILDGEKVEVTSENASEAIRTYITEGIQRGSVFMVRGFGRKSPYQTRSFNKGAMGAILVSSNSDKVGGSPAWFETFVKVRKL